MNLKSLSMLPDDIGPLGPPIRREQTKPAPAPTVEHRPDGTLTTNPDGSMSFEPKVAETLPQPVPVWPLPHAQKPAEPEEPGAHGFMREPITLRVINASNAGIPKSEDGKVFRAEWNSTMEMWAADGGKGFDGKWWFSQKSEGIAWERA